MKKEPSSLYRLHQSALTIVFLLILSLLFQQVKICPMLSKYQPQWYLVAIVFISIYMPHKYNLYFSFLLGIALDILSSTLWGHHALAVLCVTYLSSIFNMQLQNINIFTQSIFVLLCTLLFLVIKLSVYWLQGGLHVSMSYWLPLILNIPAWVLIKICCKKYL